MLLHKKKEDCPIKLRIKNSSSLMMNVISSWIKSQNACYHGVQENGDTFVLLVAYITIITPHLPCLRDLK